MDKLISLFSQQYKLKRYANSYLFRSLEENNFLDQFYQKLSLELEGGIKETEKLLLRPEKEYYQKSELQVFFNFLSHRPIGQNYKFILFHRIDRLPPLLGNKILKAIEELPEYIVIFCSYVNKKNILPTLRGRCIEIRNELGPPNLNADPSPSMPLHEQLGEVQLEQSSYQSFINTLMLDGDKRTDRFLHYQSVLSTLKKVHDSKQYGALRNQYLALFPQTQDVD